MNSFTEQKSEEYYSNSRPEILDLINPLSKKILDVGCGHGNLGNDLLEKQEAEIWGIEINEAVADIAAEKYYKVLVGNSENEIDKIPNEYFDTIILADVIEHTVDPWTLVKKSVSKLTEKGEIILSVPNISHWSIISRLLNTDFDYDDWGILDRGHLRFFSQNSIIKMLIMAGLFYTKRIATVNNFEKIPQEMLDTCEKLGIDAAKLKVESEVFQYIFRTVKKTNIDLIGIEFEKAQEKIKQQDYESAILYIDSIIEKFKELRIDNLDQLGFDLLLELKEKIENLK